MLLSVSDPLVSIEINLRVRRPVLLTWLNSQRAQTREHRSVGHIKTGHKTPWTAEDVRELYEHSQARTPLAVIAKKMKRTEGALRRKAGIFGIGLGSVGI